MIGAIRDILNSILLAINQVTNNYGISIIILTALIRILTWPLMKKQLDSTKAMQELQPELKKIQEKYKKDPKKVDQETLELMRKHQVNPLMGCLPLLIQLPILWAMFRLLQSPPELAEHTFFLFGIDMRLALKATVDGVTVWQKNPGYWLLVIMSGATTFLQQYFMITDKSQRSMLIFMPIFFLYVSISFPAGLVIYWVTNNLLSIGQQLLVNKKPKKPAGEGSVGK